MKSLLLRSLQTLSFYLAVRGFLDPQNSHLPSINYLLIQSWLKKSANAVLAISTASRGSREITLAFAFALATTQLFLSSSYLEPYSGEMQHGMRLAIDILEEQSTMRQCLCF